MKIKMFLSGLAFLGLSLGISKAQGDVKIAADVVSSYVWRGSLATPTNTPNIQPTFAYTNGSFEIGAWGSTDFVGAYKEADIYASYSVSSLKFTITDYNWIFSKRYFNFSDTTDHILEGSIGYTGPESFPISISLNTMVYGADKKPSDATKQNFSTYVELGYTISKASLFLGVTPSEGLYGTGFGIVNLGVSSSKDIKVTDSFSIPVKASFIVNPQKENIFLVLGITL